jgi:hypothetical protein
MSSGSAQRLRGPHHSSKNRAIAVKRLPRRHETEISANRSACRIPHFGARTGAIGNGCPRSARRRTKLPIWFTRRRGPMHGFEQAQFKFAFRL